MNNIFTKTLTWSSWCHLFQNIECFKDLIKEIFVRNDLGNINIIENVTPGTNAVFKVNNYLVKIFVPLEIVDWKSNGYDEEIEYINRAIKNGVKTPKIISNGIIKDKYEFYYIVFEYINAKEAKDIIKSLSYDEKMVFVDRIKDILTNINLKPVDQYDNSFILKRVLDGTRWNKANESVKKELINILNNLDLSDSYYVHGDITSENVLVDEDIYLIDFADSIIAPKYYEFPPVLFDLFDLDKDMINHFFNNNINHDLIFNGILLHDYGANFAEILLMRFKNKKLEDMNSLAELKEILLELG